jgi:hypothetical protein
LEFLSVYGDAKRHKMLFLVGVAAERWPIIVGRRETLFDIR